MKSRLRAIWATNQRRHIFITVGVLTVSLLLSVSLTLWAAKSRSNATLERDSQASAWDADSPAAQEISETATNLGTQIRAASVLRESGMTAPADRIAWVEHTQARLRQIRPISYSVAVLPAQTQPLPDELQSWYLERGLEAPVFETNDLTLSVQGIVEPELLDVLNESMTTGGAVVRTEHCQLARRPDDSGIDAECLLRRYSVRKVAAEPAS